MKLIDDYSKIALVISGTKAGARAIYSQNITLSEITDVRLYRANSFVPCFSYQRIDDVYCYSIYHKVSDYMRRTGYWSVSLYLHRDYKLPEDVIIQLLRKISEIFEREYIDTNLDKILDVKIKNEYFSFLDNDSTCIPVKHFESVDATKNKTGFYTYENEDQLKNLIRILNPIEEPELDFLLILDSTYKDEYDKLNILKHYDIPSHPRNIELNLIFKADYKQVGNIDFELKKGSKSIDYSRNGERFLVRNLSARDILDIRIYGNEYEFASKTNYEKIIVADSTDLTREIKLIEIPKRYPLIISIGNDAKDDIKKVKVDGREFDAQTQTEIFDRQYFKTESVKIEIGTWSKVISLSTLNMKDGKIILKLSDYYTKNTSDKNNTIVIGTSGTGTVAKDKSNYWLYPTLAALVICIFIALFFIIYLITKEDTTPTPPQITDTQVTIKYYTVRIIPKDPTLIKIDKDTIYRDTIQIDEKDFDSYKNVAELKKENDTLFVLYVTTKESKTHSIKIKNKTYSFNVSLKEESKPAQQIDPCSNSKNIKDEIKEINSIVSNIPSEIKSVDNDKKLTDFLKDKYKVPDFGNSRNKWQPIIDKCPDVKSKFEELFKKLNEKFPNWK